MTEREAEIEAAMDRMNPEEARETWDRQFDEDADPIRVEAAGRILTAAGWQ
jgi:hypothetical protein